MSSTAVLAPLSGPTTLRLERRPRVERTVERAGVERRAAGSSWRAEPCDVPRAGVPVVPGVFGSRATAPPRGTGRAAGGCASRRGDHCDRT